MKKHILFQFVISIKHTSDCRVTHCCIPEQNGGRRWPGALLSWHSILCSLNVCICVFISNWQDFSSVWGADFVSSNNASIFEYWPGFSMIEYVRQRGQSYKLQPEPRLFYSLCWGFGRFWSSPATSHCSCVFEGRQVWPLAPSGTVSNYRSREMECRGLHQRLSEPCMASSFTTFQSVTVSDPICNQKAEQSCFQLLKC